MSLPKHNARRDRNERALVHEFSQRGAVTWRLSAPGLPDLLIGYRGRWALVEIKGRRGQLEPLQVMFHTAARAQDLPCYVVRDSVDVEKALARMGLK